MRLPQDVLDRVRAHPEWLPLEPRHGWKSSPDEGGHTHCASCGHTIYRGDPVVGTYLKYVSVVFCPACVADNPEVFAKWVEQRPAR